MFNNDINRYLALNDLADRNGIVIFGGTEDKDIPLCELKQAFELHSKLYNRSVTELSVNDAVQLYDACVAALDPKTVLLHIGAADAALFAGNPSEFDRKYRELIGHIRALNNKCSVVMISLKNSREDAQIARMNKHLKYIAESERCDFGDIAGKRVWNPKETKDIVSFVYSVGFVRPLSHTHPIYDLVNILFCYAPEHTYRYDTVI